MVRLRRGLRAGREGAPPHLRLTGPRQWRPWVRGPGHPEENLLRAVSSRGRQLERVEQLEPVLAGLFARAPAHMHQPGAAKQRALLPGQGYHE